MKKFTSIVLLFVMSGHCLINIGFMSYYQLNKEYIAEVLCINREKPELQCQGKCFLTEKLDQANQNEQEGNKQLAENHVRLEFITCTAMLFEPNHLVISLIKTPGIQYLHPGDYYSHQFKPPRLV